MKLIVETKSRDKFNTLLSFLRSNGYKVQVQDKPLKDEDWCMPGRAATDEEQELLANAMVQDDITFGKSTETLKKDMVKWMKQVVK
ncbi:MAG: hypothetical protein KKA07_06630 [Bacteroidetes bacterium]|nr:hypothetical protein [Bacteroidota bacterium]MBU1718732.1 hypothetical protein [Bacteroidota bacterium]